MKSRKKKGRCNRKCAKMFSEGDAIEILQIFYVKRELKLLRLSNCVMVSNILTQGSIISEIKPCRRSHMILSFWKFLFFRENKLLLVICKESRLQTDWWPMRYTSSILIPVWNIQTLYFYQLIRVVETDSCIWFSCSFPEPKFSFWFTDFISIFWA